MVKNQKGLRILGFIFTLFLIISTVAPISVFAAEEDYKTVVFTDSRITADSLAEQMGAKDGVYKNGNVSYKGGVLTVTTKGEPYDILKVSEGKVQINPVAFKEAKQKDVTKAMRIFTDAISNVGANNDTVQQIMGDLQETDNSVSSVMLPLIFESTKGDMYQAYKITSPFLNVLSVVIGIGAVCLILFLIFSTVMDLAYIGLPIWREAQAGKDGGKGKNPFGVSYEAMTTVNEIEKGLAGGDGGYKNAYLLYFQRRVITYIVLAICIMYLIGGGLSGIIGFVLNLVGGITG